MLYMYAWPLLTMAGFVTFPEVQRPDFLVPWQYLLMWGQAVHRGPATRESRITAFASFGGSGYDGNQVNALTAYLDVYNLASLSWERMGEKYQSNARHAMEQICMAYTQAEVKAMILGIFEKPTTAAYHLVEYLRNLTAQNGSKKRPGPNKTRPETAERSFKKSKDN